MASTQASFEYLKWQPLYETQKPYEVFIPTSSFGDKKSVVPRSNLTFETRQVPIVDTRQSESDYSLDTHGFQFIQHSASVQDLQDESNVVQNYVPEMEELLKRSLGEEGPIRTFCFDYRIRKSTEPKEFAKRTINLEDGLDPLLPATHPHVDQSTLGAIGRVNRHMGHEAQELLKGRVRIINLWRPLSEVKAWPLAVCDGRSIDQSDLVACDIVRRRFVGETYFGTYNSKQEWYYLSSQRPEEVTMLKIYDSDPKPASKACLHCSFPLQPPGGELQRESIEIRLLVFTSN